MKVDYISFGKNVKKYRHLAGLRQADLAEICGCSDSHIGQIECGNNTPSLELAVKIANAISVTMDQLLVESYTHSEAVYLKEVSERIEKFSLKQRIVACEGLNNYLTIFEKFISLK